VLFLRGTPREGDGITQKGDCLVAVKLKIERGEGAFGAREG